MNEEKFILTPNSYTQEQWCEMYVKVVEYAQTLNSIIKEVRKYIKNYPTLRYSSMDNSNGNRLTGKLVPTDKILEILDKDSDKDDN